MNPIVQKAFVNQSRVFLRACGILVTGLKLDYACEYRIVFKALDAEYDGVAQITRAMEVLGRPDVEIKSKGDQRIYKWSLGENRLFTIKTWYEQGTVDYGFYATLEDGEALQAEENRIALASLSLKLNAGES